MQGPELQRAIDAARSTAAELELTVDDAIVLQNSTRLILRLMPCDIVARVASVALRTSAAFEVELAQRLAESHSPVGQLDPRVEPRVHVRDGFAINMWTYHELVPPQPVPPADYARALRRLHVGMKQLDITTPHFTDRIAEAEQLVADRDHTPGLADSDRELLSNMLRRSKQAIGDRGAPEQILHGEPHPGNVLSTAHGPLFIDLETCCRGPVEFDVAHAPHNISAHYPCLDHELLDECRGLILAMVAAWRWDRSDQYPDGRRAGQELLGVLREGPPWPTLDEVSRRLDGPEADKYVVSKRRIS